LGQPHLIEDLPGVFIGVPPSVHSSLMLKGALLIRVLAVCTRWAFLPACTISKVSFKNRKVMLLSSNSIWVRAQEVVFAEHHEAEVLEHALYFR